MTLIFATIRYGATQIRQKVVGPRISRLSGLSLRSTSRRQGRLRCPSLVVLSYLVRVLSNH